MEYFKARNTNWRFKSADNNTNLIRCSKSYKKEINKQYNSDRNYFKKKSFMNQVALKIFYDYFKNLNNVNNDRDGVFYCDIRNSIINENSALNRSFWL